MSGKTEVAGPLDTDGPTATTDGHLLNGRVGYRQPASGFRSGIEPVLLAASVPARAGEHVLEAGTGAGAALLCLAQRIPGVNATGVEADAALAALAVGNVTANGFAGIDIITGRIETAIPDRLFDHAIANPPYHHPAGTLSPDAARAFAKRGSDPLITDWIGSLGGALRRRGSLTLIVPSGLVPLCLTEMARTRCPCVALFPLWPKPDRPAKLVIVRGVKDSRTPMRLMPGLVLHRPDGSYSDQAEAVLRAAMRLPID